MVMNEPNRPGANPPGNRPGQTQGQSCETGLPASRFAAGGEQSMESGSQGGQMRGAKQQVRQTAERVGQQVRRQGADLVDRAQSQVSSIVGQGKDAAAGRIDTLAQALRCAADKLREDNQESAAGYAESAAEQVGRLTGYLHEAAPGDMMDDVQRFARRRPEIFIGSAIVAGFAIGRFLKASGDRNWAEREARRSETGEDWRRWEREPLDIHRTTGVGARPGVQGAGFARPMGAQGVSGGIPSYYGSGGDNPAEGGPTSGISAAATTPLNRPGMNPPGSGPNRGGA